MRYREKKKKQIKKNLNAAFFCICFCLILAPIYALYLLIPKEEINNETKYYYLKSSISYFEDNNFYSKITIDELIKNGYAKYIDNLKLSSCDRKKSYILKNNDAYTLNLECDKYNSSLTVVNNMEA